MADSIHQKMERWCDIHHLRWYDLAPEQADRAEQLARAPWALVPEGLRGGLVRWIVNGTPPGSFLQAVLRNDLADATARIDHENRPFLADVVKWLYNYAPSGCWGGPDRVADWPMMAARGTVAVPDVSSVQP